MYLHIEYRLYLIFTDIALEMFVVKQIKIGTKVDAADGINRTALREIKLLQELSHPNVIGVIVFNNLFKSSQISSQIVSFGQYFKPIFYFMFNKQLNYFYLFNRLIRSAVYIFSFRMIILLMLIVNCRPYFMEKIAGYVKLACIRGTVIILSLISNSKYAAYFLVARRFWTQIQHQHCL